MRLLRRWWVLPLILLLGLILKGLILLPFVGGRVQNVAEAALAAEGINSVNYIEMDGLGGGAGLDGLDVVLEGPAGAEASAVAAVEARGEIDQVTYRVTDDPAAAEVEPVEEPEPEPADVTVEAAADLAPAVVTGAVAAGAIELTGTVADETTRTDIVDAAEESFGQGAVTDLMTVDADAVTDEGGSLVVTGEAASDAEQADWVTGAAAVATAGGLELDDRTTVRAIEDTLNEIFQLEPIQFDTGRATIRPESQTTLDAAATALNANPDAGRLLVVGHTDSDGSDAANQQLSEARAEAVVDYLISNGEVDPGRLDAEGRGETELLVSPENSPEDKQENRRIEWETTQ